ncbi:hypothetical protein MKW98_017656 [Papaver atlanticum]|uniref:Uncharacterized protein n=1 Tax=Papaver atlanticum TaxID=357466 RepID=A0AAD4TEF7_9MAGN|nr:hypothetical protein MKW98_017656 [Papaver atlanticum]
MVFRTLPTRRYPDLKSTSRGTLVCRNQLQDMDLCTALWDLPTDECIRKLKKGARLKKILGNKGRGKEEVRGICECDPNSSIQKHLDSNLVESLDVMERGCVRGMGGEVSKTEIFASAACREHSRIENLKNQGLKTQLNPLEARFNVFEAERQDNNTAQPSAAASQQNLITRCVLRNSKKTAVALGCVNFSTPPNDAK